MIIFLYGEDEFRSNRKLAEIKNKFLEKDKEGGTLFVFDFLEKETRPESLLVELSSGGLFSNKKLAIFKNIFQNKQIIDDEAFLGFMKKTENGEAKDLTVVFFEKDKFDKKAKLAKFLLAKSKNQDFKFFEGDRLKNWIIEEISAKGEGKITINAEAAEKLSVYVGNNLFLLSKEIEKLVNFKNEGEISENDVNLLVRAKIGTDIFKTVDAIARGDKKTAIRLLHDHLEAGDDPFYILSMYFYQFRNLLKVKSLSEKNFPEREIIQKLKLHPYVIKKSLEQGRRLTLPKLKDLYTSLCEIDFSAKTGKVEIELALDKFVVSI